MSRHPKALRTWAVAVLAWVLVLQTVGAVRVGAQSPDDGTDPPYIIFCVGLNEAEPLVLSNCEAHLPGDFINEPVEPGDKLLYSVRWWERAKPQGR
jgi:hypothetical protein